MKLKLKDVIAIDKSLAALLDKELPVKPAFKLSKFLTGIKTDVQAFSEQQGKLAEKLGKPGEEDGQFIVPKENLEEYTNELKGLMEVEIDIPYEPISIDDLGDDIQISPRVLSDLNLLFTA